jgi:hypothetical protein
MSRQLRIQHWVACLEAEVEPPAGPKNFYNLVRVGYTHTIRTDTEFPWSLSQLDMYARFVGGKKVAEFETHIVWVDAPGGPRTVEVYGPLLVTFRSDEPVRDVVFRFRRVLIEGVGRYRILLRAIKPRRRGALATEYFTMVQKS